MRPDQIVQIITTLTEGGTISKRLELEVISKFGALPPVQPEALLLPTIDLVLQTLNLAEDKFTFAKSPLVSYGQKIYAWFVIGLVLFGFVLLATLIAAFISGLSWVWKICLSLGASFFLYSGLWVGKRGLDFTYFLIGMSRPGDLISFILGPEKSVAYLVSSGSKTLMGNDKEELEFQNIKELIVKKVLWQRVPDSKSVEHYLLTVFCCLYALNSTDQIVQRRILLERMEDSISCLKLARDDYIIDYLQIILFQEKEDYVQMKKKVEICIR